MGGNFCHGRYVYLVLIQVKNIEIVVIPANEQWWCKLTYKDVKSKPKVRENMSNHINDHFTPNGSLNMSNHKII